MTTTTGHDGLHFTRRASVPWSRLAVLALLAPVAAVAQTAPGKAGAQDASELEEVVVTARRRDESQANVPIAITAISPEQLLERSIRTDSDLQLAVPGLTIRQTQGNNSLTYSIRGQSADTFSNSPSAVVTYLNEVPLTISGASTFFDLESVQVLKGPQGTLFGRNATGGAVLYTTAKPTDELDAALRVRAGNLDLAEVEGMVNVPVVEDKVLLRGAFNSYQRDGYIHNILNDEDLGETDRQSGRISLAVMPTEKIRNTAVVQFAKNDSTNTGASYTYSVYQCGDTNKGVALSCGSGLLFSPALDSVFGPGSWDAYLAAHPDAYPAGLPAYVEEQRRIGAYRTRHPGEADHKSDDWMVTNTTTFDLGEDLRIKNILGASHSQVDSEQPQLGAPFLTIMTKNLVTGESGNELDVESLSEELQLQGTAFDDALSYIAGVYLQRLETDTLWPQTYFDVSPVLPPASVTDNFRSVNETQAVYAQGSYDLGGLTGVENLRVTAGARYTWEHVEFGQLANSTYKAGARDQSETYSDPSWELGLEYQATDSLLTYIKTRGSFRSGGFNGAAPPVNTDATGGGNMFDSETTQDVEAGLKFRGSVADRPAMLNVAVYQQWIDDVQRVEFPDPDGAGPIASISVTANVPEEEIKGIELEASIMAASWLELGVIGAYTDAEFTDNEVSLFGTVYSYGPVGDTPEQSGVAYARIELPTDDSIGRISLRGEIYAQGKQYFSNTYDSLGPDTKLPSYELVSARLDWKQMLGTKFSSALFGKNLTDEEYFVGGMTLASALGHNAAAVGEPRTYGLELSYDY